jgi:hypothetical protein
VVDLGEASGEPKTGWPGNAKIMGRSRPGTARATHDHGSEGLEAGEGHQAVGVTSNMNNILSNGQPTILFRPLLCANI